MTIRARWIIAGVLLLAACTTAIRATQSEIVLAPGESVVVRCELPATETPEATATPVATYTPAPTYTPEPTHTPVATLTPQPVEIIVDDSDPGFSTSWQQDEWGVFEGDSPQLYGGGHHYNRELGGGLDVATWEFEAYGRYEVFAWWYASPWRPWDVPYTIVHAAGETTETRDQTVAGGQWNSLGVYSFGGPGRVMVSDDAATGERGIVADAIRLVVAPVIVIDDSDPGFSTSGDWRTVEAPDAYGGSYHESVGEE